MGPTALLPSKGSRAADFYPLKNLSLSAGFEPAKLGSNDKQANRYTTEATVSYFSMLSEFKTKILETA
jgi:hypothetical protein